MSGLRRRRPAAPPTGSAGGGGGGARLAACLLAGAACAGGDPCVFSFDGPGLRYDLSAVAGAVQTVGPAPDGFFYAVELCGALPAPQGACSSGARASVAQLLSSGSARCLTSFGDAAYATAQPRVDAAGGLTLALPRGDACGAVGAQYETVFNLHCDGSLAPAALVVDSLAPPAEGSGCTLVVEARAAAACPAAYTPVARAGLGAAWIGLAAAVVALALYLGGGIAYKRAVRGATGMESVPNIDTWRCVGRALCCRARGGAGYVATSGDAPEPESATAYETMEPAPGGFVDVKA